MEIIKLKFLSLEHYNVEIYTRVSIYDLSNEKFIARNLWLTSFCKRINDNDTQEAFNSTH